MGDREFILQAVKLRGSALQYAPQEFKGDREVVTEAFRYKTSTLRHAAEEFKGDKEFMTELAGKHGHAS
eukprot:10874615-Heterocapsa_arctica.AAC.1